jgi:aminoglycoside phosphotransferase (APT) family kinase protein
MLKYILAGTTALAIAGGSLAYAQKGPGGPDRAERWRPTAQDMAREYRWLAALHPVFPPAPQPYVLCDDPQVIGSTFYVMERRRGLVIRQEESPELVDRPDARRRVSESVVDTLASLHAIDIERAGLAGLGKPAGFVERQVRGWTERWNRSKLEELPDMDALAVWLRERLPPDPCRPPSFTETSSSITSCWTGTISRRLWRCSIGK